MQRARLRALADNRDATELDAAHFAARDLGGDLGGLAQAPRDLGVAWGQVQQQQAELAAREDELIDLALARHGGVVARAAGELGVPRTSLISRIQARGKG